MGAWASARNVEGPVRSKAEPPSASGTPVVEKERRGGWRVTLRASMALRATPAAPWCNDFQRLGCFIRARVVIVTTRANRPPIDCECSTTIRASFGFLRRQRPKAPDQIG